MRRSPLILSAVLLSCVRAGAQSPPPGCTAPEYRQFDFWLGDWSVTDSSGTKTYGSNLITAEEAGCLLHEHWRGSQGGSGQSFNFYDRVGQRWEQLWIASGGNLLRLAGHRDGASMVLEGESPSGSGVALRNRIAWIPQADGRVRQLWHTSADQGKTWQLSFDGWYRKRQP
jgi:hypothetical protein